MLRYVVKQPLTGLTYVIQNHKMRSSEGKLLHTNFTLISYPIRNGITINIQVSFYIIHIVNVRSSGHIKINVGPRAYKTDVGPL